MAIASKIAVVVVLVAACIIAAVAIGRGNDDEEAPTLRATSAGGVVQLANSRAGQAILDARGMVPGESRQGTVTISNTGDARGATRLEPIDLADTPGPAGARLSEQLQLDVTDTNGTPVYSGPVGDMPAVDVGAFAPGEQRTYRFVATLPRDVGNDYQAARASVGFRWSMTGGGETPGETPPPASTAPSGTPPVASAPNTGPKRLTVTVRRTRIGKNRSRTRARMGRTLSRNRIRLAVICSRPCRATITGTARWGRGRHRVRKVKRVTRNLPNRATTVRLVVPKAARRKTRFAARVTVRAVASGGARASVTRTFLLRKSRFEVRRQRRLDRARARASR